MRQSLINAIGLFLVILAVLVIYVPGLGNLPVFDDRLLTSGELFAGYGTLLELKPRLLSYGSFVWLQDAFGDGWWKQRLANLAIHLCVVLALWGFYREILRHIAAPADGGGTAVAYHRSPALLLAVGFFALNPVAVYAVAYLIQRSILMATLFTVLALWSFAVALAGRRPWLFAVALVCYVLAVLAKEHALMAPLAAVPVYILVARPSGRKLALIATVGGLLVAAMATVLALRYGEIIGKPFDEYSRIYLEQLALLGPDVEKNSYVLSIFNQAWLFFKYGLLWFLPYAGWMSIDMRPPFPVSLMAWPQTLAMVAYLATIAGGLFLLIRYRDWRALVGLAVLLPATLFVTEFSTVWVQDPFVLYRGYLWAIGLPGLVFFLFHGFSTRLLLVLGLGLAALFVWQGLDRVASLATPEKVWTDAIAKLPDDAHAVGRWFPYLNRAELYLDENRLQDAYRDFRASDALDDRGMGMYNIGAMLAMMERYSESLQALAVAENKGFASPSLGYQRGVALYGLGRMPEAREEFLAASRKAPSPALQSSLRVALAKVAMAMGNQAEARGHYDWLARTRPDDPRAPEWRAASQSLK